MYYYFVRYTIYSPGEPANGMGSSEISTDRPITKIGDIRAIEDRILKSELAKLKAPEGKKLCVMIDFYSLLRYSE